MNTIQNTTRDIIDNANANSRAILDFLTQDKIATLTAENQSLKFQASQAAQNAFFTANQEAQTAELIRRCVKTLAIRIDVHGGDTVVRRSNDAIPNLSSKMMTIFRAPTKPIHLFHIICAKVLACRRLNNSMASMHIISIVY